MSASRLAGLSLAKIARISGDDMTQLIDRQGASLLEPRAFLCSSDERQPQAAVELGPMNRRPVGVGLHRPTASLQERHEQ